MARSTGRAVRRTRQRAGLIVLGALSIGLIVVIAVLRGEQGGASAPPTGSVAVPNLVGQSLGQARIATTSVDLVLGEPSFIRSDAVPDGTVVSQTPGAGTLVGTGTEILTVVSTSRVLVEVPDVVGLREADAIVVLADAGLRIGDVVRDPSSVVTVGAIIVTMPPPGREVASGTRIDLVVSTGDLNATPSPGATPGTTPDTTAQPSPSAASPSPAAAVR